jgi:hypothetical protein
MRVCADNEACNDWTCILRAGVFEPNWHKEKQQRHGYQGTETNHQQLRPPSRGEDSGCKREPFGHGTRQVLFDSASRSVG